MSEVTRTTVYLDAADYRRLKVLARAQGTTTAQLVREAVAAYTFSRKMRARPSSVGAGRSVHRDVAAEAEDLLKGMGRKR